MDCRAIHLLFCDQSKQEIWCEDEDKTTQQHKHKHYTYKYKVVCSMYICKILTQSENKYTVQETDRYVIRIVLLTLQYYLDIQYSSTIVKFVHTIMTNVCMYVCMYVDTFAGDFRETVCESSVDHLLSHGGSMGGVATI